MSRASSIAKRSLRLTGAFEADLLLMLLLRQWNHPLAEDEEFRDSLLDAVSDVLRASVRGERLFEDISPEHVNLVAAVWYVEFTTLAADPSVASKERKSREKWMHAIRRAIPSCFCNPDDLL